MKDTTQMISLTATNVSVNYPIYSAGAKNVRSRLREFLHGRREGAVQSVEALRNVSIDLQPGAAVGLIGLNGAGKSTFLKVLAGILEPTSGLVTHHGRVSALLSMGNGMSPELDGYQNIRRLGLLRGFSRSELDKLETEIVQFADIGRAISLPLRTYSSGMRVRLSFAIATAGKPDILLIDEVFGAGDARFREKAHERMERLISEAKIFVFSTHSKSLIKEFCSECIYLEKGQIKAFGPTDDVLKRFRQDVRQNTNGAPEKTSLSRTENSSKPKQVAAQIE